MDFKYKKPFLFLFFVTTLFGGCGDFSGNYEEIESTKTSSSDTGTTDTETTVPTNPSISINSGTSTTTSSSVTLSLSASDNVGVTGYYLSTGSSTPSSSASGWTSVTSNTAYSANVSYTLTGGAGTNTVYVWFKDAAGNVSSSASESITLAELTLTLITSWGSLGTNSGQFSNPQYTQVYGSKIYVADEGLNSLNNKKVAVYDLSGNLENEINFSSSVTDLCIYNSRLYVVSGGDVVNLNISNTSDNYTIDLQNFSGSSITAYHCAANSNNIFILTDGTNKEVNKYSLSNFQSNTADLRAITSWGSGGTGSGQYMGSGSIIADENYVYISSRDGSGITKFDTNGNVIAYNGSPKIRQIYFNPSNSSEIFGWDQSDVNKFKIYNTSLTELKSSASVSFSGINGGDHGLSADSSGNIYISGYNNNYQVSKYLLTRN